MSWQDDAVCAGSVQPKLFTGEDLHRDMEMCADVIATFCADCPVWSQCLEWAHGEDNFEGIAGGWVWTSHGIREPGKKMIPRMALKKRAPVTTGAPKRGHCTDEFNARGWV